MPDPLFLSRRQFMTRVTVSGALGAASAGFASSSVLHDPVLDAVSAWNDAVQASLFGPDRRAQTYEPDDISVPVRYNGILPQAYVPRIDPVSWKLKVSGQVQKVTGLSLGDLGMLPQHTQITRLICIEGWSFVGQWSGPRLSDVLKLVGADLLASYVVFDCADGYHTSIDMDSAMHPQTILAIDFLGAPLSPAFGAPARLRIPTKLGFKNAKNLLSLKVTNAFPGGYWEEKGYNWFAGL